MFDNYQSIFDVRGDSYHAAMQLLPDARRREFEIILDLAELQSGQVVCDMPSGGGYLQNYLGDSDVELVLIEPSKEFYDRINLSSSSTAHLCELDALALDDACVDTIISLAGLHHVPDKRVVFAEMHRVLRPQGRLCVADVREGSDVDRFLNVFVDRFSSFGHEGEFVDTGFFEAIERSGFELVENNTISYLWEFSSATEMATYCKMLFSIDEASVTDVLQGIDQYLGYNDDDGVCHMNWELAFIACQKPSCST